MDDSAIDILEGYACRNNHVAGADAIVGLVQNRKEGVLVLLMKQHKTMLLGHDMGEINQHIHRQGKNS